MADVEIPFVDALFEAIDWCDQSASPPAKARDTHALQFNFYQDADDPGHPHVYRGLLFYTPPTSPGPALSLGNFDGMGSLVAQRHACQQIVDGLTPFPWVRIQMATRRRPGVSDPQDPDFAVNIAGLFTYFDATRIPGFPPELTGPAGQKQQAFETDVVYGLGQPSGEPPVNPPPHLVLVGPLKGKIFYIKTTVIPAPLL